jgi:hypothetical protein
MPTNNGTSVLKLNGAQQPQVEPPETGMQTQLAALERGVRMRIIYDSNLPDVLDQYADVLANGAQIRRLESAPLRLALRDSGGEGLVALVARSWSEYHAASVRIIHAELVAPFQMLFNRQWRQATPVAPENPRRRGRRAAPSAAGRSK